MEGKRPAKDVADIYELSPIQQGLLFEQLAQPGIGIYVEQLRLEFDGTLDTRLFEQAWQRVVDRHPILRTSFHWHGGGKLLQVVHRAAGLPLEVLDWRELDTAEQDRRLDARLNAERLKGFNLATAPMMRSTLVRRGDEDWTFSWRFSHLLMDGWSFTLAIQNFIDNYRALCREGEPDGSSARPYREYLAWWRARDPEPDREFWRSELRGYVPPGPLRIGGAEVADGERTHSHFECTLTGLAGRLAEFARAEQLTLATIVQGAWMIVLGRYLGREDIACGVTMAHRPGDLVGAESILGPMVTTLPVRERLEPTRVLRSWLRDSGRHVARIGQHTSLPLNEIQPLLGRSGAAPLLQSSVSYENVPMPDFALEDVGARMTGLSYDGRPHYPITMVIMPGEDMPLRVMHDRRQISDSVARGFAGDLISVLWQIVEEPELTIGELRLSGQHEVVDDSPRVRGPSETLHSTFAAHAARAPDRVAVRCDGRSITYRDLDRLSDSIAEVLREREPAMAGLLLDPSIELIAAMIGVFKAGAAYVPLDPAYPEERLAYLLADSGADVVLTAKRLRDRIPDGAPAPPVFGEELPAGAAATGSPAPAGDPGSPAYLLYTSGSTGKPKGVLVTHRNVQSLLEAGRAEFGFDDEDVWTLSHSFSFDYSVWEIWGALGNGGTLVVVPQDTRRDPRELRRLVYDEQVTVLSQTPAVFEQMVPELTGDETALRHVFLGGDRLDSAALAPWFDRFGEPAQRIHNLYGVTEATVVSTSYPVPVRLAERSVPIGRAMPNQRTYLLDKHDRQVPSGATGELCVAGPAVAAGYHRRPELTAERFGPDPFVPGDWMYRTGDLAAEGADGALRFSGRADTQVKIRGFRVEPGEIESVLRDHPDVRTATVVTQGEGAATRLAGFVVAREDARPASADELVEFAARALPPHMVPSALTWLPEIPTTPSGKVDMAALPAVRATTGHQEDFVAPRSAVERHISEALADILGVEKVGVLDPIDGLGLHSIDAMRLTARLRTERRIELPLPEVLEATTVEALAQAAVHAEPAPEGT